MWPIPALTSPCCLSFASGWWKRAPRPCCWIACWRCASRGVGGTAGGKQRTDSTHVLARVRSLSNLECLREGMRAVLDDLAALAPEWLVQQISLDWLERYSHRVENYRLPKAESQRTALAQQIGADGLHLLHALEQPNAPAELKEVASVQLLQQVWQQYYDLSGVQATWRARPQAGADEGIMRSPYEPRSTHGQEAGDDVVRLQGSSDRNVCTGDT